MTQTRMPCPGKTGCTSGNDQRFDSVHQWTIGLSLERTRYRSFAGQEIKLINGPIFVDHPYVEREIVALSESKRTESNWIKTKAIDEVSEQLVAEVILNSATQDSVKSTKRTLGCWA